MRKPLRFVSSAIFAGLACSPVASASPVISVSSVQPIKISSARLEKTVGGASCVTGMVEPSFGCPAAGTVNIHVFAYGRDGKLLAEKTDKINFSHLVRWHLHPHPSSSYVAFFPWAVSEISKVAVVEGRK